MGGCRRTKVHLRRDTIPASTGSLCRYLYGDTSHPKDKEVFFYAEKRTLRRPRTGPRHLCPDGLRSADRAERGTGAPADHHSQQSEPLLSEAVPILLAGLLFGPLPGAAVGFAADFIGCLFSPFGYNPIFCLPPILYGLWAGLVRRYVWRRPTLWRAALAVFPAAVCGSVLWQSMALALVYGGAAKWPYFLTRLAARSVQFAITGCIDALLVWLLMRRNALSPVLRRIKTKGGDGHDAG